MNPWQVLINDGICASCRGELAGFGLLVELLATTDTTPIERLQNPYKACLARLRAAIPNAEGKHAFQKFSQHLHSSAMRYSQNYGTD
jgi:hypothetical protein